MISMIACIGKKNELGRNNSLIWHIPKDMKFFKETTIFHKVIMGRKTYESLPGKLSDREMIVISTGAVHGDVEVVNSINSIVDKYKEATEEVFIIGGAKIYSEFMQYADKLYLTEVDDTADDADTFFPKFKESDWKKKTVLKDSYKDINYKICIYERKII